MKAKLYLRRTTIIILFCISTLIGLIASKHIFVISVALVVVPLVFSILAYRFNRYVFTVLFCICCFGVGVVRGQSFASQISHYQKVSGQKVVIVAKADNDGSYDDRSQTTFDVGSVELVEPYRQELPGKVKIAGFVSKSIFKNDQVMVVGKIYATRGSRSASISFANIEVIESNRNTVDNIRREFASGLNNVMPEPQAPLGMGLLIGQKTNLGSEVTDWLKLVGLTHIIAVSGYNLTIIIRFIHRVMNKRSRYQTVALSVVIIALFLLMTGFSASIVRATIVCGLSLIAWYYGRKFKPMVILGLTAAMTALYYPIYIWSDIGWYLSFLAFFGVLVLAPTIVNRYFKKQPNAFSMVVIETVCAQIMTLPIVLYIFGQASWISLLANVLVVPIVPLAMLATLLAGLAGMIAPATLFIVALPSKLLLSYILWITNLLSRLPSITINTQITLIGTAALYAMILFYYGLLYQKNKSKHAIITDENLI